MHMDVITLLELYTSAQVITVKRPTVTHPDAGIGLFRSKVIGKGKVASYYYGSLVSAKLIIYGQITNTYGEGEMQMTVETSQNWANEQPEKDRDKYSIEHEMWIVPEPFSVMQ